MRYAPSHDRLLCGLRRYPLRAAHQESLDVDAPVVQMDLAMLQCSIICLDHCAGLQMVGDLLEKSLDLADAVTLG